MKRSILIPSILAASVAFSACATTNTQPVMEEAVQSAVRHQKRGVFPFQGEHMTFEARHVATKAVLADAQIDIGYEQKLEDGTRYIPIIGTATSKSIIRLFARVDDRAEAYLDPDTWETLSSYKHLNENDRDREYYVSFFPDDQIASVERHQKGRVVKRDYVVPNDTMDSIAWVFFVRTMNLEVGKTYTQYTYDGWTINYVELKVVGEEDVWTENGFIHCQKYEIWRERSDGIEPYGALSGVYIDPPRKLHVKSYHLADAWLATDEIKTPVRLVINTGIGEFDLLIKSYSKQ
ncbi:MAG: DUF3108 domain-containing protein [Proteobacteria bacterium]|nr:DUF3108 domain-containing protein [Pseudomonadota bacterium]